jgi:outer membrane protein OmpA-like peptidoglycan-associated protein
MFFRWMLMIGLLLAGSPAGSAQESSGSDVSAEHLISMLRPSTSARGIRPPALGGLSPLQQHAAIPPGVSAATLYVLFGAGSASLTPGAERTLDQLGRALVSPVLAGYRYRIEGHTDGAGSHEQNRFLSERRAEAVRDYLVERFGMEPDRFEIAGLGATQPVLQSPGQAPEPLNRRVQVVNLGR